MPLINKPYKFNFKSPFKSLLNLNDEGYIVTSNKVLIWFLRISVFIIYAYFGIWKIFGLSPAEQVVTTLHKVTLAPIVPISSFLVILGVAEVAIGFMLLLTKGKWFRVSLAVFLLHMLTTFAVLVLLPNVAFHPFPVPTMEAQYVIKNLVLIGSVLAICQLEKNQEVLKKLEKC